MEVKLNDAIDLQDELDHIHASLTFMNFAIVRIHEDECVMGEQLVYGQMLIFDWIGERVKAVSEALATICNKGGVN